MDESTGKAEGHGGKPTVLLVDDDPALRRSLERVLSGTFQVQVENDGQHALEALMKRGFDVIVSDIEMPRMNGVALLEAVRKYDLDVPVILMTGAPTVESAIDAVSLGALQYLVKPVRSEVLLKALERATKLHRLARVKRAAMKTLGEREDQAGDRAGLMASFDRALQTMWMAVQPIVDVHKKRVFGYEALMRSTEPSLPHPGAILAAAERLDRREDLGRHVRSLAAQAFQNAPEQTLLFVNLQTVELLDPALYEASAPLSKIAGRVVLEVTERAAIDEIKDVPSRIGKLRDLGFRVALDDLGAGYAGLSSFAALEPEIVKLDMALVRNVHQSPIRQRLVASMTSLCKEMDLQVVAEGVEVPEELESVRATGCQLVQGYFFAKPGRPFPTPASFG